MEKPRSPAETLVPLLYEELRGLAATYLRDEKPCHTLQPTALVHEAFLRLADRRSLDLNDRGPFRAAAAQAMRRILVDHARRKNAEKRGGDRKRVSLDEGLGISDAGEVDLLALHEALEGLAEFDARQARVVELRFFGGQGEEETAETLGVSLRTVQGDWRMARAWLREALSAEGSLGA